MLYSYLCCLLLVSSAISLKLKFIERATNFALALRGGLKRSIGNTSSQATRPLGMLDMDCCTYLKYTVHHEIPD